MHKVIAGILPSKFFSNKTKARFTKLPELLSNSELLRAAKSFQLKLESGPSGRAEAR